MTLEHFLQKLGKDAKPPSYSALLQLSGLSPDEVAEFKGAWASVPQLQKRETLGRLVELCEDNLELDFSGVFRACLNDLDEDVREKATLGLWECDDTTLIRPFTALLEHDPSSHDPSSKVRAVAGRSLGKFAALAQNGKLLDRDGDRIREALIAAIGRPDEDLEVRRQAIEAVASFDLPEIDEIIWEAYQHDDLKLKQSSLYAMGQSSNARWLPTVLQEMDHEHVAIRYEAAGACSRLGDESTVPHLIKLIQDEDLQVQLAAVRGLGAIGGPLAERALKQCLKMGDEAVEETAKDALSDVEFDADPLGVRFEI